MTKGNRPLFFSTRFNHPQSSSFNQASSSSPNMPTEMKFDVNPRARYGMITIVTACVTRLTRSVAAKTDRKETLYREMRIVEVAEEIMAASVNPLSSSRAVTRDDAFANGWRTVRTRRERRNLTRVCRTRATTMDALFAARRLQIAKVDLARNRDGESPRITSNSHSRVILDLA